MGTLSLQDFDDRLLDGLLFCRKVYRLFDEVSASPGGVSRLRRRSDATSRSSRRNCSRSPCSSSAGMTQGCACACGGCTGNQQHDAKVLCSGGYVDEGFWPRRLFLEVTSVMHEKDYLRRELLDTEGRSFGVGNITRDRKSRKITSKPYVYNGHEANDNMLAGIRHVIAKKAAIAYPKDTILLVQCFAERLALLSDWEYVVEQLQADPPVHPFREIFLIEAMHNYTASL